MAEPGQRTARPKRVSLDRDKILAAALEVADERGPTGMTMREVGARLGADPTAVYRHFRSKDELVAAMADRLFSEILVEVPTGTWRERLAADLRLARGIYRAHPAFVPVLAQLEDEASSLRRINERTFACLQEAGLGDEDIGLVHQVLVAYVVGTGLLELSWQGPAGDQRPATRRAYAALPPDDYPASAALAPVLFPDEDAVFEVAVELLLDAIEQRAASSPARKARSRRSPT